MAWAFADFLARERKAFTLFATHYVELTHLAEQINTIANVHIDAVEHGDKIVFLHAVKDGPANQSYGLQVAQLAGVPKTVIAQAKKKLRSLEKNSANTPKIGQSLPLQFSTAPEPTDELAVKIKAAVQALEPDELTPKQALEALYRLKAQLA